MTETKAVPALLRALNERTVLDAVRASGPVSRAEVARRTGISRPTVSLVLRALLEDGLVRETAQDPDRPHYGAVYYEADAEAALVLGVDFGSRSVRTALCDLAGEVRAREEIRSRGSVEERIAALASTCRSLLRTSKLDPDLLARAVVALPAVISPADGSVSSPDLPGLGASDLREQLERAVGAQVTLENDVNLAALGEQRHGVAQGVDDFAFLLVGAGLGAAVVLAGKLRGRNGAAASLTSSATAGRTTSTRVRRRSLPARRLAAGGRRCSRRRSRARAVRGRRATVSRSQSWTRSRTASHSMSCRSRRRSTSPSSSSAAASARTPTCSSRSGAGSRSGSPSRPRASRSRRSARRPCSRGRLPRASTPLSSVFERRARPRLAETAGAALSSRRPRR